MVGRWTATMSALTLLILRQQTQRTVVSAFRPSPSSTAAVAVKAACRRLGRSRMNVLSADPSRSFASSTNGPADEMQRSQATSTVLDPLVVCGPSGVGKGTIIQRFMETMGGKEHFDFSVSHTTRKPRPGETDGVHYHFVSTQDMEQAIRNGEFLEYAQVHGNYYGTSRTAIEDVHRRNGKRCLLDVDVQGVQTLKQIDSDQLRPKYLFIAPPSLDALHQRLVARGSETPETLERRKKNAVSEMVYGMHQGNFDAIVVNDDLEKAVVDFATVVRGMYQLQQST